MISVVLDMDVGIDDALMLMHLVAEPTVEIVAIGSTHGNCSSAQAAINAIRVLDALDRHDIPVTTGHESPIPNAVHSWHVHGHDGLGDAGLPAPSRTPSDEGSVAQILRLAHERPGELTLVAVGTMTNLAAALDREPEVLTLYKDVWILGGISHRPAPEERDMFDANVYNSPDAADRLFSAHAPLNVTPIDVTYEVVFSDDHLARINAAATPAARLAARILPYYLRFYEQVLGRYTCAVHDPTTSAALVHPELVTGTVRRPMIVEPTKDRYQGVGLEPGEAGYPTDRQPATIVTGVDSARLLDRIVDAIVTPLGQLPPSLP